MVSWKLYYHVIDPPSIWFPRNFQCYWFFAVHFYSVVKRGSERGLPPVKLSPLRRVGKRRSERAALSQALPHFAVLGKGEVRGQPSLKLSPTSQCWEKGE